MPPVPTTSAASSPSHPHLIAIRTPRLRTRTFQPRDAAAQRALNESTTNTEHEPRSQAKRPPEHYEAWIARQREAAARGDNNFMVVALPATNETTDPETGEVTNDIVIGIAGFNAVRYVDEKNAEVDKVTDRVAVDIGVMIDSAHWRKGYGKEVLVGLVEFGLAKAPDGWGADLVQMQTEYENDRFLGLAASVGLDEQDRSSSERVAWHIDARQWQSAKDKVAGRK